FLFNTTLREEAGDSEAICFRHAFEVNAQTIRDAEEFRLEATSVDGKATVWINGQELKTSEKPKRGKLEYLLPRSQRLLRAGRNAGAVRAPLPAKVGDVVLELRLDEVRALSLPLGISPEAEVSEKAVTERAVVCDLCSSQFGQRPACVNACPHDAAWRIDARTGLPPR